MYPAVIMILRLVGSLTQMILLTWQQTAISLVIIYLLTVVIIPFPEKMMVETLGKQLSMQFRLPVALRILLLILQIFGLWLRFPVT